MYWVAINDRNQQQGEAEREQQHKMSGLLVETSRRKRGRIREGRRKENEEGRGTHRIGTSSPLAANGKKRKGGGGIVGEEVGGDGQNVAGNMRSRKSREKEEEEVDGQLQWEVTR